MPNTPYKTGQRPYKVGLDLNLVMGYWGKGNKRSYHHTAPINALYGLHEALVHLREEGLENAWARHRNNHAILRKQVWKH